MNYIVLDLEFNQDLDSLVDAEKNKNPQLFEIIQIGAVKLDSDHVPTDKFNRYIKPSVYSNINPFITELTGITTEWLAAEKPFTEVFKDFVEFIGGEDSVFCVWGMSDIKELYKAIDFYRLDNKLIPNRFINLQPYVSHYLGIGSRRLLSLENAVESLGIPRPYKFHDAYYDAHYTAEIFKKIKGLAIKPENYDPNYMKPRIRQKKRRLDTEALIKQFEKMYQRSLTEEEQGMVILAYKMGKTGQFLI